MCARVHPYARVLHRARANVVCVLNAFARALNPLRAHGAFMATTRACDGACNALSGAYESLRWSCNGALGGRWWQVWRMRRVEVIGLARRSWAMRRGCSVLGGGRRRGLWCVGHAVTQSVEKTLF